MGVEDRDWFQKNREARLKAAERWTPQHEPHRPSAGPVSRQGAPDPPGANLHWTLKLVCWAVGGLLGAGLMKLLLP